VRLLIDEHLSPRLVGWCAERRGMYAVAVAHIGLAGMADRVIWRYALDHDYVTVTTNARHFLPLLNVELHPGLIVLREGSLSRDEQWERLAVALDHVVAQPEGADAYLVNRVVEVVNPITLFVHELPAPGSRG
jgi:predicted nuclease of predicted toxin-antitoxin system